MLYVMSRLHDNDLDKLFADKLDDFRVEPPERVWRKVAIGITVLAPFSATALSNLIRPILWSLTSISTVFLLTVSNTSSDTPSQTNHNKIIVQDVPDIPADYINQIPLIAMNSIPETQTETTLTPLNNNYSILGSGQLTPYNNSVDNVPVDNNLKKTIIEVPVVAEQSKDISPVFPIPVLQASLLKTPQNSWNPTLYPNPDLSEQHTVEPAWFDFSYESGHDAFAFNDHMNPNLNSMAFNNGLSVSFHFSDFYLRTGVNLMNLKQQNLYDYTANEYQQAGEYTLVDSISFIQGTDTSGQSILIPQYYTSMHPYYDSVQASYTAASTDKYRFLEIPFVLGLQKDIRRITLYVQSGFTYSFLLNSKELSSADFSSYTHVYPLSWQPQSSARQSNFWSFTLAAGAYYNTNTHFAFGLEPTYRYYLDPFFESENGNGKAPVSYGLRARILYKF